MMKLNLPQLPSPSPLVASAALAAAALTLGAPAALADHHSHVLQLKGGDGPGKGKHIVLIAGDEEYRSEEALPMLAKILSQWHGFNCTVVFSWDETGTYIDPNHQPGLRGLKALQTADLMIISTRFRRPNPEEAKYVTAFLNAGKPVIGLRTATHAFTGGGKFGSIGFGEFGRKVLGEQWVNHHGGHKRQGARGVVEEKYSDHPVLRGVDDVFGPSDVYGVTHLTASDKILLRGAVTETLDPESKPVKGKKNDPMMPLAWLHTYTSPDGKKQGKSFCTTMGASVDLVSADLRRLVVNAAYHLTGLTVPQKAPAAYVDPFYPSFYGFIRDKNYWKNANHKLADYALGKTSPVMPDPRGSPDWPFRPVPKKEDK